MFLATPFKREAGNLERVMEKGWSIGVDFVDDVAENWPKLNQRFKIRHLSNEVDSESRTFNFVVPIENQSRVYEGAERTSIVWRFRPGQRVRLQIPVEKIENVLVLPAAAVVRDGAEVYAFQEIGKFYRRFPVHVIYQDRPRRRLGQRWQFASRCRSRSRSSRIAKPGTQVPEQ